MPDFIDLHLIEPDALRTILKNAHASKAKLKEGELHKPMVDRQLAMLFEKPSTRTRASFEVGMNQLGGHSVVMNSDNSQMGRGESIADTARVLSRYVDLIMIRCFNHETLLELCKHAEVPVINGLTDSSHPCQIMADIMTFEEHNGNIAGKKVAWFGDSNNVLTSWIHAATQFDFTLHIATPESLKPDHAILKWASSQPKGTVEWSTDPIQTASEADLITTDTWFSMGDEEDGYIQRKEDLAPYQVSSALMSHAQKDAIFMHCLPAHRGEEVTEDIIDGKQSVIFDEAENRLHAQKAVMIWCLQNAT